MKRFKICLTDGFPDGRRVKTKSEPSPGNEARSEYRQSQTSGRAEREGNPRQQTKSARQSIKACGVGRLDCFVAPSS